MTQTHHLLQLDLDLSVHLSHLKEHVPCRDKEQRWTPREGGGMRVCLHKPCTNPCRHTERWGVGGGAWTMKEPIQKSTDASKKLLQRMKRSPILHVLCNMGRGGRNENKAETQESKRWLMQPVEGGSRYLHAASSDYASKQRQKDRF